MAANDFNKILALKREGKLPSCTKAELLCMREVCFQYIPGVGQIARDLMAAVEEEIRQKELIEAEESERQRHKEATDLSLQEIAASHYSNWLSKLAIGISLIALVLSVLAWLFPRGGDSSQGGHGATPMVSMPSSATTNRVQPPVAPPQP